MPLGDELLPVVTQFSDRPLLGFQTLTDEVLQKWHEVEKVTIRNTGPRQPWSSKQHCFVYFYCSILNNILRGGRSCLLDFYFILANNVLENEMHYLTVSTVSTGNMWKPTFGVNVPGSWSLHNQTFWRITDVEMLGLAWFCLSCVLESKQSHKCHIFQALKIRKRAILSSEDSAKSSLRTQSANVSVKHKINFKWVGIWFHFISFHWIIFDWLTVAHRNNSTQSQNLSLRLTKWASLLFA